MLKTLTQFHEHPAVIAWWTSTFSPLLNWFTPTKRRAVLIIGALLIAVLSPIKYLKKVYTPSDSLAFVLLVAAILAIVWLLYQASVLYQSFPATVKRHPHITLHVFFWLFYCVFWNLSPSAGLLYAVMLGIALFLPKLLWRLGYMLSMGQSGKIAGQGFSQQLICLFPVYGGTNTPYGKGLDFISKFEAKTPEALAKSQLAGLKLLLLSGLWALVLYLMEAFVYGSGNQLTALLGGNTLGIPKLSVILTSEVYPSRWQSWASLYCELFWQVLRMARNGHGMIAVLRLFGFYVFRNTYKPLLAESVHEFWNRYYYYFKELLVHFFFMPVFMQLNGKVFKQWHQLRLALAVFSAAFLGNMYYHLLYKENLMLHGQVYQALYESRCDFFYGLLLAIGIYLSMLKKEKLAGKPLNNTRTARSLRILGVWTFFSLIYIWDIKSQAGFLMRLDFFLNLFGF